MAKATRLMIPVVLVSTSMLVSGQTAAPASQDRPLFMGRAVTIVPAEYEKDDGLSGSPFPKTPASVCVEPPPQRQCYTPPDRSESPKFPFGNNPGVIIVQLKKDTPALFFSAETGGVSGWEVHFALLRPGTGKELENLFVGGIFVSNQNQHAFWSAPAVSCQQIFVTAEDVWEPGEGHYGEHRYIISSYVARSWEEGTRLLTGLMIDT